MEALIDSDVGMISPMTAVLCRVFRLYSQQHMTSPKLDEQLDRDIGDLTAALGDPTRRAIYIAVRQAPIAVTTSSIAEVFDLHPNVARHHLDRLANEGYLEVSQRQAVGSEGRSVGRPAKHYAPSSKEVEIHFAPRRYELLVELLIKVIGELGSDDLSAVAEKVGRQFGMEIAIEIGQPDEEGYPEAVSAVAKAMTGLGFSVDPDVEGHRLLTSHCPFGNAGNNHPEVVCSLDRGIVAGLMASLAQDVDPVVFPAQSLNANCVTEIPLTIG
ncbi:MAG: helix-turn-helix domain-containing protein [Acidimicrobiia bacterium]|nr:helix-turn-helix domain-containing protein [Acidimicrobiia bacterium]